MAFVHLLHYGLLLCFLNCALQSCSAIGSERLNINPITREDLLTGGLLEKPTSLQVENQPLIHELRGKLGRLRNEEFVDGSDPNNNDMRKHLMFVFSHWLKCKQRRISIQDRIDYFRELSDFPNLLWSLFPTREDTVEFRIKSLYSEDDPRRAYNLSRARTGLAPFIDFNGVREKVHIDHLVRDNKVTIEIPEILHKEKTRFIDNFTNIPKREVRRNSTIYWSRFRNGRN